jgi:hypothetical protein
LIRRRQVSRRRKLLRSKGGRLNEINNITARQLLVGSPQERTADESRLNEIEGGNEIENLFLRL